MQVNTGQAAPDFTFTTAAGESKQLSELWKDQPTLVLWMRHFG